MFQWNGCGRGKKWAAWPYKKKGEFDDNFFQFHKLEHNKKFTVLKKAFYKLTPRCDGKRLYGGQGLKDGSKTN